MPGKHGETLVVDWGLAKLLGRRFDSNSGAPQSVENAVPDEEPLAAISSDPGSETARGSFAGTPAYAPPEQLRGELDRLCPASDVYSLGAVLYELLTGQQPIPTAMSLEQILKHVTAGAVLAPRSLNPSIDKSLNAVCLRAIASEIEDRYPSVEGLKRDVEAWLDDMPVSAIPETASDRASRWFRKHRAAASTGLIGVALVALVSTIGVIVANHYRMIADEKTLEAVQQEKQIAVARDRELSASLLNEKLQRIDLAHSPHCTTRLRQIMLIFGLLFFSGRVNLGGRWCFCRKEQQ